MLEFCGVRAMGPRLMVRGGGRLPLGLFAVGLALVASFVGALPAEAKRPGSTYCFVGKCHRVKSLGETRALVGKEIALHASHYNDCSKDRYNPCGLTSSGEPFHPDRPDNAASPIYPDGTVLLVRNPKTKAAAVLRINNAGPYWGKRKLDVSYAAAEHLGFRKRGVAKLETKIIAAPNRKESRYVRRRAYRALPGFIGKFESLAKAEETAVAMMMLHATAASTLAPSSGAVMVAAVQRNKKQRAVQKRLKRTIVPIVKKMRLIADLKATEPKVLKVANHSIQASPSRISGVFVPAATGVDAPATAAVVANPQAPSKLLAQAALNDVRPEAGFPETRSTRSAVQLIRTAEVGARERDAWHDLLMPRLGAESIVGGRSWGGDLPLGPLPGRAPRDYYPGAPVLARDGMTG